MINKKCTVVFILGAMLSMAPMAFFWLPGNMMNMGQQVMMPPPTPCNCACITDR